MQRALRAERIFDGWRIWHGHALLLDGPGVIGIVKHVPKDVPVTDLGDGVLAPGCVDLQVNGGGG